MNNGISLDDLGLFFLVAEKGSFLRASAYSQVSHVTLQRRISALERQFGKKLFIRTTTGVIKTEFALQLMLDVKNQYSAIQKSLTHVNVNSKEEGLGGSVIKILASAGMSYFFLEQLYPKIQEKNEVQISITTYTAKLLELNADRMKSFIDEYDCIFIEGDCQHIISQSHWSILSARSGAFQFYATEGYLKKHGQVDVPEGLERHNCLILNSDSSAYIEVFEEMKNKGEQEKHLVHLKGSVTSDVIEHLMLLTCHGMGVGLLPDFYVNSSLNTPLIRVLPSFHAQPYQVYCLRNTSSNCASMNVFAQQFREILKEITY